MIGISKVPGTFAITPHKVSVCLLIKMYVPPVQAAITSPFSSVAQHNRLGLFLFALTKSFDDIFEPKLTELLTQLRQIRIGGPVMEHWLGDNLTRSLTSLSSPDDLFNLFIDLRGDFIIVNLSSLLLLLLLPLGSMRFHHHININHNIYHRFCFYYTSSVNTLYFFKTYTNY